MWISVQVPAAPVHSSPYQIRPEEPPPPPPSGATPTRGPPFSRTSHKHTGHGQPGSNGLGSRRGDSEAPAVPCAAVAARVYAIRSRATSHPGVASWPPHLQCAGPLGALPAAPRAPWRQPRTEGCAPAGHAGTAGTASPAPAHLRFSGRLPCPGPPRSWPRPRLTSDSNPLRLPA